MEISQVTNRTHLAPTSGPDSKKIKEVQDANRVSQTPLERGDSLTLSEEVRKLAREKKLGSTKKGEEARSPEWEDVHRKEKSARKKKHPD
jgi:hypothetical protein